MYDLGHKKRQERGICRKVNMLKRKFHKSSLDVKIHFFNHIVINNSTNNNKANKTEQRMTCEFKYRYMHI